MVLSSGFNKRIFKRKSLQLNYHPELYFASCVHEASLGPLRLFIFLKFYSLQLSCTKQAEPAATNQYPSTRPLTSTAVPQVQGPFWLIDKVKTADDVKLEEDK